MGRWWRSRQPAAALALDDRKPDWHCKLAMGAARPGPPGRGHPGTAVARSSSTPIASKHTLSLAGMFAQRGPVRRRGSVLPARFWRSSPMWSRRTITSPKRSHGAGPVRQGHLPTFGRRWRSIRNSPEGYLNIGNLFLAQGRLAEAAGAVSARARDQRRFSQVSA